MSLKQEHLVRQYADGTSRRCIAGYIFQIEICPKCLPFRNLISKLKNKEINFNNLFSYYTPDMISSGIKILPYLNNNKKNDYLVLCSNNKCDEGEVYHLLAPCDNISCCYNNDLNYIV